MNARLPELARLPESADDDADQDRRHQGFEIGLAGEVDFDLL